MSQNHHASTRRAPHRSLIALVALGLIVLTLPAAAAGPATADHDRLFLSFIEDGSLIENQWWEGQLEMSDGDVLDSRIIRGIVALRPWDNIEVGARVGFGSTDTPAGVPDGSGGTDLDLWGKYRIDSGVDGLEYAVGSVVTVPTGDDTAGLGFDAFSVSAFGSMRRVFDEAILAAHVGLRMNGDGNFLGSGDLDGDLSIMAGIGVIVPVADRISVVGEIDFEGDRFDGAENDARLLGGVNWRMDNNASVRGAVALGLADGAPDLQLLVGYAARF